MQQAPRAVSQCVSVTHLLAWRTGPHAHTLHMIGSGADTRHAVTGRSTGSGLLGTQHTAHTRTAHEVAPRRHRTNARLPAPDGGVSSPTLRTSSSRWVCARSSPPPSPPCGCCEPPSLRRRLSRCAMLHMVSIRLAPRLGWRGGEGAGAMTGCVQWGRGLGGEPPPRSGNTTLPPQTPRILLAERLVAPGVAPGVPCHDAHTGTLLGRPPVPHAS